MKRVREFEERLRLEIQTAKSPDPLDGEFESIRMSLSCDHRAIDGAVGARFLATLKSLIEDPKQLTL